MSIQLLLVFKSMQHVGSALILSTSLSVLTSKASLSHSLHSSPVMTALSLLVAALLCLAASPCRSTAAKPASTFVLLANTSAFDWLETEGWRQQLQRDVIPVAIAHAPLRFAKELKQVTPDEGQEEQECEWCRTALKASGLPPAQTPWPPSIAGARSSTSCTSCCLCWLLALPDCV